MNICILIHNFSFLSHVFTCTYCGRIGHEEKTCYQLHGFPSDSEVSEPQSSIPILMVIDIHEPFSLAQLKAWNDADHFFNNFNVRLDVGGQSLESAVLLTDVTSSSF
ncbi:hypothetical protein YC2023_120437 [Brassica napus]